MQVKILLSQKLRGFAVNSKYLLIGLICFPFSGHYNALIIKLFEDFHASKKNKNYFYDDRLNNNEIIEIKDNWKDMININLPNILIYAKQ